MNANRKTNLSRRDFLKVAGGVAVSAILVGCASPAQPTAAPEQSSGATDVEPTSAPASSSGEKIELRWWLYNDPGWIKGSEDTILRWKEINPNVNIKLEHFPYEELQPTIQTAMAAKNEADLIDMFGTWVHSYIKGNTLAEAPAGVMSLAEAREIFYTAPLDGYVLNDKLYGMPHEFNLENGGALVNKAMFEADQLKYPPVWTKWEEIVADAQKLVRMDGETMTRSGFNFLNVDGITFWLWEGILERGANYFADDGVHLNVVTQEAQDTVQWMLDLIVKDKVTDPNLYNWNVTEVQDSFFQEQSAIAFRGPWVVPGSRITFPDFKDPWSYESLPPLFGDKYNFAADSGWGLTVSPNSANQNAAWDFVKFVAGTPENARLWNVGSGTVPALKSVAEDPSLLNDMDWLGPSIKVLPYGRFVGDLQDRDMIWYDITSNTLLAVMQGQMSVQEGLEKINKDSNDTIDAKLQGSS
jgi:multiple sugar transport system substrate-binding protein